ncbi:MAG: hypothetical protein QOE97_3413 [Pseudonocardiales bacterium]|jgi:hypothetical protein|nr:hypothetical protein [Pseudonocardiales bacterium]
MTGAVTFARYAYPPNQLGYCGPDGSSVLLDAASPEAIADHARRFEGAWPYLEILARAAGVDDPLDERVVRAYWVGNELLDEVDPGALVTELRSRFGEQPYASWVPGLAHHSYHVFAVYPWVGLVRRGTGGAAALSVLEKCRIRTGEVLAVDGETVTVRSRPLVHVAGRLGLGEPRDESAAWAAGGRCLPGRPPEAGELVALHWDWVCEVLGVEQAAELERRSADQLGRTNAGAAEAAG